MNKLQSKLLAWGDVRSVFILSLICVITAACLTYLAVRLVWAHHPIYYEVLVYSLTTAVIVTFIIAPVTISLVVKLLFKIHALEKEARLLATFDALTGLLTRRAFYEIAEKQLKLAARHQHPFAIMVADLDAFKLINDTYGHHVGDEALSTVGQVIFESMRESDLAGRLGGDEFVFCLPNTTEADAKNTGQRLLDTINDSEFSYHDNQVQLSVSLGLHVTRIQGEELLSDLIHAADMALYQAKEDGKGCLR